MDSAPRGHRQGVNKGEGERKRERERERDGTRRAKGNRYPSSISISFHIPMRIEDMETRGQYTVRIHTTNERAFARPFPHPPTHPPTHRLRLLETKRNPSFSSPHLPTPEPPFLVQQPLVPPDPFAPRPRLHPPPQRLLRVGATVLLDPQITREVRVHIRHHPPFPSRPRPLLPVVVAKRELT